MNETLHLQTAFVVEDPRVLSHTDLTTCQLLIQVGTHYFSYVLLDAQHQQFIDLKSYYFPVAGNLIEEVERILDRDKILLTSFKLTRIAFDTPRQTLVPATVYSAELKEEYLKLLYGGERDETIFSDPLPDAGMVNVYGADRNLAGYLKKEFPSAKLYHAQTALLQPVVAGLWKDDEHFVLLQVQQQRMSLLVFSGRRVLYQHQFAYHKGLDIVYHVLNVMRQLKLPPQHSTVLLGGDITEDSEVYQELYKFIEKLEWVDRPASFRYIEKFNSYPRHYFYNLFALALCE